MESEAHRDNRQGAGAQEISNCPNCHALMPREMRFCRACGCRLGEGVEEYTETVRFRNAPPTSPAGKSKTAWTVPPVAPLAGGLARNVSEQSVNAVSRGLSQWKIGRACQRVPRWVIWIVLPLIAVSMINGPKSVRNSRDRGRAGAVAVASNSFLGAHYKTANGGAFIEDILPPGSAADKAGLVGGDTITSFDGKPVRSNDDLTNLLIQTPVGKTVEVVYTRDGETRTTKLTTVSEEENGRLEEEYNESPKGFLGVDDDEFKVVTVPGTNITGVQMNEVYKNRPGYIAGLRDGDIVISFNGVPIRTPGELNRRIDRAQPDSIAKLVIMRGNERLEIPVKMGEE